MERPTLQTLPFVESAGKRGQHKEKLVGQIVQVPDLELPVLLAHQALRVQESLQILGPKGHRQLSLSVILFSWGDILNCFESVL